jgi:hypothetical protein
MNVFWIVLAAIAAIVIALFQYNIIFSSKNKKRQPWFALLRASTIFLVLLLFIAPQFESKEYQVIKPQLVVLADNSKSIVNLDAQENLENDLEQLLTDQELIERYDVIAFNFDDSISNADSLDFAGSQSNITAAIEKSQQVFKNRNKAVVILTDGNQTIGANYAYADLENNTHLYPVVYGDTTRYVDLRINQLNVNRYSYLDNEFPVEVFVSQSNKQNYTVLFKVTQGNTTLYQQRVSFSPLQQSQVLKFNLRSSNVGLQKMQASLSPLPDEKNTSNNYRNFAVEVIDQQSKILILADVIHPDLAAIKNAIESNKQRTATIATEVSQVNFNDFDLVVMYGVGSAFAKAQSSITQLQKNTWLILGPKPDLRSLNRLTTAYQLETYSQTDDTQPVVNEAYPNFNLEQFNFEDYPPVRSPFGELQLAVAADVLFYKQIGNVVTEQPLWFTYDQGSSRHAVTLGEGLWRWRTETYLNQGNFQDFDALVNSQVQFLANRKKRNRLSIDFKTFYYENEKLLLNAQYLDENYEFQADGILDIDLRNLDTEEVTTRPFVPQGNTYSLDLSGIPAGDYTFTVKAANENLSRTGSFTVLEFDLEQQFINANYSDLQQIATNSKVYDSTSLDDLKETLANDELLTSIERETITFQSLIDWKILLGIILILLAVEWFLRKYNGLI